MRSGEQLWCQMMILLLNLFLVLEWSLPKTYTLKINIIKGEKSSKYPVIHFFFCI